MAARPPQREQSRRGGSRPGRRRAARAGAASTRHGRTNASRESRPTGAGRRRGRNRRRRLRWPRLLWPPRSSLGSDGPLHSGKESLEMPQHELLSRIQSAADVQKMSLAELNKLADEMRDVLCNLLSTRTAHFASNLGVVEL